ncbi:ABC transporter permease [Candidatus Sumerlaeota bacterium]|nr:ABC transporter permease [Candidatus Sumerlaeota bacterium]
MAPSTPRVVHASLSVRRAAARSTLREIWNHRSILWLLTRRDLKARYAGSLLGILWNVIHPIVMIAIYILILGTILTQKWGGGVGREAYALYLCAGMIPWLVFQEIVTRCSSTLLENASLIKKVAFPEIVLHLTVTLNAVFVHIISYSAFIVLVTALDAWPGARVLLCFAILLGIALMALGLGLLVSVLNIYFRDVGQVVIIGLQFLFWFTPIVYSLDWFTSGNPGRLVRFLRVAVEFNPVMHFTRLSQWLFGVTTDPRAVSVVSLAAVVALPLVALGLGTALFNRFKNDLLDNI